MSPKIVFNGAGSTVLMKNIVGDLLLRPALAGAKVALMETRHEESAVIANKLIQTLDVPATAQTSWRC